MKKIIYVAIPVFEARENKRTKGFFKITHQVGVYIFVILFLGNHMSSREYPWLNTEIVNTSHTPFKPGELKTLVLVCECNRLEIFFYKPFFFSFYLSAHMPY